MAEQSQPGNIRSGTEPAFHPADANANERVTAQHRCCANAANAASAGDGADPGNPRHASNGTATAERRRTSHCTNTTRRDTLATQQSTALDHPFRRTKHPAHPVGP